MKKIKAGNIYVSLPTAKREEVFETILRRKGLKIERITSFGQATPEGEWLKEKKNEWVVLLKGRAVLRFKGIKKLCRWGRGTMCSSLKGWRIALTGPCRTEKAFGWRCTFDQGEEN